MTKGQQFAINSFVCFHNPYSEADCEYPRGGVSCLVSESFMQYIVSVNTDMDNFIKLIVSGNHILFGNYIPPVDSIYFSEDCFADVSNVFMPLDYENAVVGGGDLNGRFGNLSKVPMKGAKYRTNPDREINSHGKTLKNISSAYNCFILNNLSLPDKNFDGNFTFRKADRKSQVDICLSNLTGINYIESFKVNEIGWNPSDHNPIVISCTLPGRNSNLAKDASQGLNSVTDFSTINKPRRIKDDLVNWENYSAITETDMRRFYEESFEISSEKTFNKFLDSVTKKMYNTAVLCYNPINSTRTLTTENNTNAREIALNNNADVTYRQFLVGEKNSTDWMNSRCRAINEMSYNVTQSELDKWKVVIESKNPKELWQQIDWKGEINHSKVSEELPTLDSLAKQFISKSSKTDCDKDIDVNLENCNYVDVLDTPIDVEEIRDGCRHLKASKATFDGWCPNMITRCSNFLFPIIEFIFNFILLNHIFPISWILTLTKPIFKNKGSRNVAKFFRPVSLIKMLSKLLDFILVNRFKKWFTPSDEQSAYQAGRSCGDNIFLVRCIISLAKRSKQKLYLITVDFDGAFDRISRKQLFKKLILFGAGATYVACLMAIYNKTECIIFGNNENILYAINSGIKQGSPMSPMLFLFYIDDVFEYFVSTFASFCIYEIIHVLMHADDLILIASSRSLAISKVKHLIAYCRRNSILLEPTKSHFIVINATDEDHIDLKENNILIGHCSYLSLLGSHLSESGCLKDDLTHHLTKRYQTCIKFYNFVRSNKLAPLLVKLKVLKSCVLSNLLYNCETFGKDIPKQLDIYYFKLLKTALGVRKNVPNDILLIECGFLPLKAIVYGRQLNFFRKFRNSMKEGSSRYKLFNMLLENVPSYLQHYVDLDRKYNNSNEINFEYLCKLKDKIRNLGRDDSHYRYYMYMLNNPDLTPSAFVHHMRYISSIITRFRLGSHFLPIETGRWSRKPRNDRLCPTCNVLGDEKHLIYNCCEIDRTGLHLPNTFIDLWKCEEVIELFERINRCCDYL